MESRRCEHRFLLNICLGYSDGDHMRVCVLFTSGFREFSSMEKISLQEKSTAFFSTSGFQLKQRAGTV